MTVFAYQPFKAVYTLIAVLFEAARIPLWMLLYLPTTFRPHKKWTFQQALRMKIVSQFLKHSSNVEVYTPMDLKPGAEKERFVTFGPAPAETYVGPTLDAAGEIKPVQIGGTWTATPLKKGDDMSNVDVVLHFHGGAFVIGDGRDHDTGFLAKTLLKHARVTHVFTPNYRLSSNPLGRFPAAFQDAVSTWYYLTKTLGIPASKITISGDSAGGNLALALMRYISSHGAQVGFESAGAAFLWSPWVDVEAARRKDAIYESPHYKTDYLCASFAMWGARCYAPIQAPATTLDPANPYVTPIGHPFKTETPIWVQTGDAEVLFEDDVEIASQMKKIGNKVDVHVSAGAPHDIILVGPLAGFVEEAKDAAKKAGEWLRSARL